MAAITRVKAAQQRYETVPVLGRDGEPIKIQLKNKDGSPRTDKRGHLVFITKTEPDRSKPKPVESCGKCGKAIEVGDPYKHISPKSGPYGGRRLVRCAACPDWQRWEYSSSLSARLEEISYYFWENIVEVSEPDDVQSALDDAAQAVTDLAEEKRASAENIEQGFQHATYQSDELNQVADDLESWASDISNTDIPSLPEPAWDEDGNAIPLTPEQVEEWRDEVRSSITVVDEAPV
jgi:hypothetical protein